MKQKMDGGVIFVKASKEEGAVIKTWRLMKYDKEKDWWYGDVSRPLLENLKRNGGLIDPAKRELEKLDRIQAAVDAERVKPDEEVKPLCKFPVKVPLFTHQNRAANMAAYIFGLIEPERKEDEG